jgi:hypothetical protein
VYHPVQRAPSHSICSCDRSDSIEGHMDTGGQQGLEQLGLTQKPCSAAVLSLACECWLPTTASLPYSPRYCMGNLLLLLTNTFLGRPVIISLNCLLPECLNNKPHSLSVTFSYYTISHATISFDPLKKVSLVSFKIQPSIYFSKEPFHPAS